jgi:hypothetical protein
MGVDLGQANDPTAICIIHAYAEREDPFEPLKYYYDVVHLQRLPLGMSYPAIVSEVGIMLSRPPLDQGCELVLDDTGVGRAVGDIFQQRGLNPIRVSITSGNEEGMAGSRRWTVPKAALVSLLDATLHTGELRFASELREAAAMREEFKDFGRHVSEAGRYSFSAREGKHDDLVLACAIALWRAVRKKPKFGGGRNTPEVNLGYSSFKKKFRGRGK